MDEHDAWEVGQTAPIEVAGRTIDNPLSAVIAYLKEHSGTVTYYDFVAGTSGEVTAGLIKATDAALDDESLLFLPPSPRLYYQGCQAHRWSRTCSGWAMDERPATLSVQVGVGPSGDAEDVAQATFGSPPFAPTTCPTCTPSLTGSSAITPPCWPGSPCPTHLAPSKAKSARSKFLKRLMFGRASYDLLRKMALLN